MLAVLGANACMMSGGERVVGALELRAAVVGASVDTLDARVKQHAIWTGATEAELYVSRGQPALWWNTRVGGESCKVFVHHGADLALADIAVTTCRGRVVGTNAIAPALPCWRLTEVGPRIAAAASYFDTRPLDVQWQIVIGLVHRGQAEQDVLIAFGQPHNRGFDEREDGRRAEKLVFLDHSGDAYGLDVTLVDNKVVGWQMPAERTLTPEAQQRRLDALEKRMTDKIAQVEKLAIAQHAESVKMFNDVMSRQDQMIETLTKPPSPVVVVADNQAIAGAPTSSTPRGPAPPATRLTGNKTMTINGKTYTDGPDGELGRPCGVDNNTCTAPSYSCALVTSRSGMCVPR